MIGLVDVLQSARKIIAHSLGCIGWLNRFGLTGILVGLVWFGLISLVDVLQRGGKIISHSLGCIGWLILVWLGRDIGLFGLV